MKQVCLILLFLLFGVSISTFSQSNLSDSSNFIKKPINNENISYTKSKAVLFPVLELEQTKLATSGLEAYKRLLNYYESEKAKATDQGLSDDEIESNIKQLNAKILFEKNKSSTKKISYDFPANINTGKYELDTKTYDNAKKELNKKHPE